MYIYIYINACHLSRAKGGTLVPQSRPPIWHLHHDSLPFPFWLSSSALPFLPSPLLWPLWSLHFQEASSSLHELAKNSHAWKAWRVEGQAWHESSTGSSRSQLWTLQWILSGAHLCFPWQVIVVIHECFTGKPNCLAMVARVTLKELQRQMQLAFLSALYSLCSSQPMAGRCHCTALACQGHIREPKHMNRKTAQVCTRHWAPPLLTTLRAVLVGLQLVLRHI